MDSFSKQNPGQRKIYIFCRFDVHKQVKWQAFSAVSSKILDYFPSNFLYGLLFKAESWPKESPQFSHTTANYGHFLRSEVKYQTIPEYSLFSGLLNSAFTRSFTLVIWIFQTLDQKPVLFLVPFFCFSCACVWGIFKNLVIKPLFNQQLCPW